MLQTEEILVNGCLARNNDAYRMLYERFSGKLMGVCIRYAKSREEAEDILQEGFIKIFKNIHQFKKDGSFEGWMRKIMVNTAIEYYRKAGNIRMVKYDDITEDDNGNLSIPTNVQMEAKDLLKMVHALPHGCKMIFNLYAIEGYSHKEIAKKLNISEGTSKSQLSRARILLQQSVNSSLMIEKINKNGASKGS